MRIYLFILTWVYFPNLLLSEDNCNVYLIEQFELLNKVINEKLRTTRDTQKDTSLEQIAGSYIHSDNATNVNIFTFFNKTFFFIKDEIFLSKKVSQNSFNLSFYTKFNDQENVKFFKAIQFRDAGVIIENVKDEILIHNFNNNSKTPDFIQKIFTRFTSDALLFINHDNLYLIITTNHGEHISFFTLYKWLGTHFDEIEVIYTDSIKAIGSFAYKNTEIIILLQNKNNKQSYSSIFEFKFEQLKKIQYITTRSPQGFDVIFQKRETPYILIYQEVGTHLFYKWNGFEMVLVNTFQWKHKVDKSVVVYSNSTPLIVLPQVDKIIVYQPQNNKINLKQELTYSTKFSNVLNANNDRNENGSITFIVGSTEDKIIEIYAIPFKPNSEIEKEHVDTLGNCFNNLEQTVYDQHQKINQTEMPLSKLEKVLKRQKRENVPFENVNENYIESKIEDIRSQLNKIKAIHYDESTKNIVINVETTIPSIMSTKSVKAHSLDFKNINENNWEPEKLLRFTNNQEIVGKVKIPLIKTKIVLVPPQEETLFKKLLFKNSQQKLHGKNTINSIIANKITTSKINNINVTNIYKYANEPVKGRKSFANVFTNTAEVKYINNVDMEKLLSLQANKSNNKYNFAPEIQINNLVANVIDGVNWKEFKESIFINNENSVITGNITVPSLQSEYVTVQRINGVNPDNLLTISTDQIINASVEFNQIRAFNIQCKTINDIDLNNTVSINQNGTVIEGPVILNEGYVNKDVELTGDLNNMEFFKIGDRFFGTDQSDFRQIYTGRIVINGDLHVKNMTVSPNATVNLDNKPFSMNILKNYWTKNTNQTIPVHFEALSGVTMPSLNIRLLNDIPIRNFTLNKQNESLQGPLFFEDVHIMGNVTLNKSIQNNIDLQKISREGIRSDNKTYKIGGKKVFKNNLKINNLKTDNLNNQVLNNNKSTGDEKKIKKMIIKGDLSATIKADVINTINIEELNANILPIISAQNITKLELVHISVDNLYASKVNGYKIEDYLKGLAKISNKSVSTMNIKGNVTIRNAQNVSTLNNHEVKEILNKKNRNIWNGDIHFPGKTKIKKFEAEIINDIDFPALVKSILLKKSDQIITGAYTFDNLKTNNLYVKKINEIHVENLIDITKKTNQTIILQQNLVLNNVTFTSSLESSSTLPCNFHEIISNIQYPQTKEWKTIEIVGDTSILDEENLLHRILEKTVKKNEENTILSPVHFHNHLITNKIVALGHINGINLTELIEDAVLSDADEEQIITTPKIFSQLTISTATVTDNTDCIYVNDIVLKELFNRIIKNNGSRYINILGEKIFFGGLQTDKFYTTQISGLKPENIVDVSNAREISEVTFDSVISNNLVLNSINDHNFDEFLNKRLLRNITEKQITNAIFYFTELDIRGGIKTRNINNIDMENVVFDVDKQKIRASKRFTNDIMITGNANIELINGINVSHEYHSGLLHRRNELINGSLTITKPVKIDGTINAKTINGYPVQQIKEIMTVPSLPEEEVIFNMTEKLKRIVLEHISTLQRMPNELLYIEKSENLQIKIKDSVDARVSIMRDYALIHILSEENYEKCQLPIGCRCPVQYTVEITPKGSINNFTNKQQQRIYSYDDENITVYLLTNTISTDSYCKVNNNNYPEKSIMTWSTTKINNRTGAFNMYPGYFDGYISDVEFFTLEGITYVIIARYYDVLLNTHDLDCIVLKFSQDKKTVSEIQRIPTKGVWTISLLLTAQGIVLVIGNIADTGVTEIYRFDEYNQQFRLQKTIPYQTLIATGVVVGTDSLIILANKIAPLHVLKYDPNSNNYRYYQILTFDEVVVGLSTFYVGGYGISDAYLTIVTEDSYRIYSFQYIDGFKLESIGSIKGLKNLVPFYLSNQLYLLAASEYESSLLIIIKHGAGET